MSRHGWLRAFIAAMLPRHYMPLVIATSQVAFLRH